ncbi:GNAT family acetyltransferase [Sphingomonas sp. VNH70]|uniref:GNAT family acetyltransferase n=1 Tax=Sphingomonas silueang TaxID=3156617 RepID=UPI0032B49236
MYRPVIADAMAEDAAQVVALWEACGLTRPWNDPHADFHRALATPTATVLIARTAGQVVGSAMVGHDGHRGWVYYLAVAADARRQGIGRALMDAAADWLLVRGVPKLQLMVRDDNGIALNFHEACGLER